MKMHAFSNKASRMDHQAEDLADAVAASVDIVKFTRTRCPSSPLAGVTAMSLALGVLAEMGRLNVEDVCTLVRSGHRASAADQMDRGAAALISGPPKK